jgi:hypothetical protein
LQCIVIRVFFVVVIANGKGALFFRNVTEDWRPNTDWAPQTVNGISPRRRSSSCFSLLLAQLVLPFNLLLSTFESELAEGMNPSFGAENGIDEVRVF